MIMNFDNPNVNRTNESEGGGSGHIADNSFERAQDAQQDFMQMLQSEIEDKREQLKRLHPDNEDLGVQLTKELMKLEARRDLMKKGGVDTLH